MANNREHMLNLSSTLGLPEKLFLFRERLQKWMWSSQEGLQWLERQQATSPLLAGLSQESIIEFRLAVSVAQHKLNRIQKRLKRTLSWQMR